MSSKAAKKKNFDAESIKSIVGAVAKLSDDVKNVVETVAPLISKPSPRNENLEIEMMPIKKAPPIGNPFSPR